MKVLLAWLGAACCVPLGSILGGWYEDLAPLLVVGLLSGTTVVALVFGGLVAGPRRRRVLLVCAYAVLAARGVDAGRRPHLEWTEGTRGVVDPLRTFETVAPSTPGARCRVSARPTGSDMEVVLSLPPEICPLGAGERWWVHTLVAGTERLGTTGHDDTAALVQVDHAYRHVASSSGVVARVTKAVAELRQVGWHVGRGDDAVAFVGAAVLGLRGGLTVSARESLRAAGLGHLVAISGLHVALVGWWALRLGARAVAGLGWHPALGVWPAIMVIAAYVLVAGAPASAVRAGLMAAVVGIGSARRRPTHGLTTLAAAVAAMLAVVPQWTFDPGFHLSVAAMAAVVTSPAGASTLRLTWRVTWAVAAPAILHFGMASPWGCLANLVAIPVATSWVMPLGLLGALALPWVPGAWAPAAVGAELILDVAAFVERLPALGPAGWGGLALALVGARVARAGRARGGVPIWVYAATACAVLLRPSPALVVPQWLAIGGGPRPTVVTFADAGSSPRSRHACVHDAPASPTVVLTTLERMGVDTLGPVTPTDDPAGHALLALARRRGWDVVDADCPDAPSTIVRAALRRCARDDRWRAAATADQRGNVRCVRRTGWSLLDFGGFRR